LEDGIAEAAAASGLENKTTLSTKFMLNGSGSRKICNDWMTAIHTSLESSAARLQARQGNKTVGGPNRSSSGQNAQSGMEMPAATSRHRSGRHWKPKRKERKVK
jgi:hypothetical protein